MAVVIGLPILALVVVLALLALWASAFKATYSEDRIALASGASAVLLLVLVGAGLGYWPYSAQYHRWTHVGGVVTDVASRLVAADKATDQKIVLLIAGQEYGCAETRCALVKPGDRVDLSCKRAYQWTGTPGWDCNFIRRTAGPRPAQTTN